MGFLLLFFMFVFVALGFSGCFVFLGGLFLLFFGVFLVVGFFLVWICLLFCLFWGVFGGVVVVVCFCFGGF